jgi:putative holliday junction resolvase
MRYLGIDFGSKKVGLALSDEEGAFAFPHAVVPNDATLLEYLIGLIAAEGVEGIVMGESQDNAGKDNPIAHDARAFTQALERKSGIPVVFEPEWFTSREAERIQGKSELTDASAAALILQSYLDKHHGAKT